MYVSIIVPVYNSRENLSRCIESILHQSFQEYELILVDDGSSDGSEQICDNYALIDNRIKVYHKPNNGVCSARNMGIEMSQGEKICFIDCDDCIEPYMIEHLNSCNADLVTVGVNMIGQNEGIYVAHDTREYVMQKDAAEIFNFNFESQCDKRSYMSVWSHLFNKAIIDEYNIRFNSNIKVIEDTMFMMEYLTHCHSIIQLPFADYIYYDSNTSFSKKYALSGLEFYDHIKGYLRVSNSYKSTFNCGNLSIFERNIQCFIRCFYSFFICIKDYHEFKTAVGYYCTVATMISETLLANTLGVLHKRIVLMKRFPAIGYLYFILRMKSHK